MSSKPTVKEASKILADASRKRRAENKRIISGWKEQKCPEVISSIEDEIKKRQKECAPR